VCFENFNFGAHIVWRARGVRGPDLGDPASHGFAISTFSTFPDPPRAPCLASLWHHLQCILVFVQLEHLFHKSPPFSHKHLPNPLPFPVALNPRASFVRIAWCHLALIAPDKAFLIVGRGVAARVRALATALTFLSICHRTRASSRFASRSPRGG